MAIPVPFTAHEHDRCRDEYTKAYSISIVRKIMEKMISLPIKRFPTRNISPRSGSIPPPTVVAIVGYVLAVYVDSVASVISVADVT